MFTLPYASNSNCFLVTGLLPISVLRLWNYMANYYGNIRLE